MCARHNLCKVFSCKVDVLILPTIESTQYQPGKLVIHRLRAASNCSIQTGVMPYTHIRDGIQPQKQLHKWTYPPSAA